VDPFSKIAYYSEVTTLPKVGNTQNITIATGITVANLDSINGTTYTDGSSTILSYFNFDFTGFTNSTNPVVGACLVDGETPVLLAGVDQPMRLACSAGENKGIERIMFNGTEGLSLNVTLQMTQNQGTSAALTDIPFVTDIFSFGAGVNNAIYRLQLTESDANSGEFGGTIEYTMLNQINIDLDATYTNLATIDDDIGVIVEHI
jgi:hypothetical protein